MMALDQSQQAVVQSELNLFDVGPLVDGVMNVTPKKRCVFELNNPTDSHISFKLKRTSPDIFKMFPAFGYIKPKGSAKITVLAKEVTYGPADHVSFLLCRVPAVQQFKAKDFWDKKLATNIQRKQLSIVCGNAELSVGSTSSKDTSKTSSDKSSGDSSTKENESEESSDQEEEEAEETSTGTSSSGVTTGSTTTTTTESGSSSSNKASTSVENEGNDD